MVCHQFLPLAGCSFICVTSQAITWGADALWWKILSDPKPEVLFLKNPVHFSLNKIDSNVSLSAPKVFCWCDIGYFCGTLKLIPDATVFLYATKQSSWVSHFISTVNQQL